MENLSKNARNLGNFSTNIEIFARKSLLQFISIYFWLSGEKYVFFLRRRRRSWRRRSRRKKVIPKAHLPLKGKWSNKALTLLLMSEIIRVLI